MRQKPARRRRKDAKLEGRPDEWGHTLLADHVSTGDLGLSFDDDKYGLVMLDVGSNICDVLAANKKNVTSMLAAIKEFGGAVKWTYFFSDSAKKLKKAAVDLGSTVHLSSTPYRPESTGIVERALSATVFAVCWANPVSLVDIRCEGVLPWAQHAPEIPRRVPVAPALWSAMTRLGQHRLREGALQEAAPL